MNDLPELSSGRDQVAARAAALSAAVTHLEQVIAALEELAEAIARHGVEAERADGVLGVISERAPRLASAVDELRADHARIPVRLREEAESVRRSVGSVREVLADLERHRSQVDHLFYEAFDTDLGGLG